MDKDIIKIFWQNVDWHRRNKGLNWTDLSFGQRTAKYRNGTQDIREVELIPPKEKKYQLKLYKDDDLSYVTCSSYENDFNYDLSDKNETCEFITKFTQEEIDNDKFLKFIEQHGIKEEVE